MIFRSWSRSRRTVAGLLMMILCVLLVQVASYSYVLGRPWDTIPIHMYIGVGSSSARITIEALRAWNDALSLRLFDWSEPAPRFSCKPNATNTVTWQSRTCDDADRPVNWRDETLAIAFSWGINNHKIESDVLFNSTKKWAVYHGAHRDNVVDFRRVALHEFGHVLGLQHVDARGRSQRQPSIMTVVVSDIDRIRDDDISGVAALYGRGGAGAPDLIVESLTIKERHVRPRQAFIVSASVRNAGSGTAAATSLVYRYRNPNIGWVDVEHDSVAGLRAGRRSAESVRLTAPRSAGRYDYQACVYPVNGERNSNNNCRRLQITVSADSDVDRCTVDFGVVGSAWRFRSGFF